MLLFKIFNSLIVSEARTNIMKLCQKAKNIKIVEVIPLIF